MRFNSKCNYDEISPEAQVILLSDKGPEWKMKMLWQRKNFGFRVAKRSDGLSVLRDAGKCIAPNPIHTEDFTSESMCKTNISRRWKDRKIKRDEESARLLLLCK